jgi:hypothetical protein
LVGQERNRVTIQEEIYEKVESSERNTASSPGAHAPSRADFGALAEIVFDPQKVRDREGAIASARGACAPRMTIYAISTKISA